MDRDPFWALKELFRALRVQLSHPQTWPLLLVAGLLILPAYAFIILFFIEAEATQGLGEGWNLSDAPGWVNGWIYASLYYVLILLMRLDGGRKANIARLSSVGWLAEPGQDARTDKLLDEVKAQCRASGITRLPDVYVYDQAKLRRGAFAHAGLTDNGRVALPSDWLAHISDAELRFIVGHELAHIRHRDGFIHVLIGAFTTAFAWMPILLCCLPIFMFAVVTALMFAMSVFVSLLFLVTGNSPLQPFVTLGEYIYSLTYNPMFVWPLIILGGLLLVSGALELYRLWVGRRQELKADELAAALVGGPDARTGIDLIDYIERAGGRCPGPITARGCREVMLAVFAGLAWLVRNDTQKTETPPQETETTPQETEAIEDKRTLVSFLADGSGLLLYGLWKSISWIPGVRAVPQVLWRLTRTHPTPEERKRHLEKVLAARSTSADVGGEAKSSSP